MGFGLGDRVSAILIEPVSIKNGRNPDGSKSGDREVTLQFKVCCLNCGACESPTICGVLLKKCEIQLRVRHKKPGGGYTQDKFMSATRFLDASVRVCSQCAIFTVKVKWHGTTGKDAAPDAILIKEFEAICICCEGVYTFPQEGIFREENEFLPCETDPGEGLVPDNVNWVEVDPGPLPEGLPEANERAPFSTGDPEDPADNDVTGAPTEP